MLVYYPIRFEKQTSTLVGVRNQQTDHYEFGIFFCDESKPINLDISNLNSVKIQCRDSNHLKIIYSNEKNHSKRKPVRIEFLCSNDRKDFIENLMDARMIESNEPTSITCCLFPCIAYYQRNYKFVRRRNPIHNHHHNRIIRQII